MSYQQQFDLENEYLMPTFARKSVCLVEGRGMRLRDSEGAEYLDFLAGIGCVSIGHCHPALVSAIQDQAARLVHVGNYYYIEQRGQLAKRLSGLLGQTPDGPRWKTFFVNSGAEANECAMKLARLWSKKHSHGGNVIITLNGSFHGRTMETLAATAQPVKQELFAPMPEGFVHVPINDTDALRAAFDAHPNQVCAVMVEVIQGESGVHPCTAEFLELADELVHANGGLLICDEVQTGVFRTGKPFAFQHFSVQVDIAAIAKGIGGGFPMGACTAHASVADSFEPGTHGTTFGGSNLAIAAAGAVLDTIESEGIAQNVQEVGAYLQQELSKLPYVTEVRGRGLMVGAELAEGMSAPDVVAAAQDLGLLINATGPTTLRFLPPLVCAKADVDELVNKLGTIQ